MSLSAHASHVHIAKLLTEGQLQGETSVLLAEDSEVLVTDADDPGERGEGGVREGERVREREWGEIY